MADDVGVEGRRHTVEMLAAVVFWSLFGLRYATLLTDLIKSLLYTPVPVNHYGPFVDAYDCSVIVPVADLGSPYLLAVIRSILNNHIHTVYLVTVGDGRRDRLNHLVDNLRGEYPHQHIHVGARRWANKREQLAHAIPMVVTSITILSDDCTIWPRYFLSKALAPFDDSLVGGVAVNKRVRRSVTGFSLVSFLECLMDFAYEASNFKQAAAAGRRNFTVNNMDGQISFIRTEILNNADFLDGFLDERFPLKSNNGPFQSGDDNFITRWLVSHNWKIAYQSTGTDCVEMPLKGRYYALPHVERRLRSSFKHNLQSLFIRQMWQQPYSFFTSVLASLYDVAFFGIFGLTSLAKEHPSLWAVVAGLHFASKLVPAWSVFYHHPMDLLFLPGLLLADYFFSVVKLKAVFDVRHPGWHNWPVPQRLPNRLPIEWIMGYQHILNNMNWI